MRKYITFLLLLLLCTLPATHVFALVKISPSPSPSIDTQEKINSELQARIASRVAQLNLVEKKGVIGTVNDVNNTQISISDVQGNNRFIDVDELTKFVSSSNKSFGISDIHKGDTLGILGLYNKQSRRILARFVTALNLATTFNGIISGIDRKAYN